MAEVGVWEQLGEVAHQNMDKVARWKQDEKSITILSGLPRRALPSTRIFCRAIDVWILRRGYQKTVNRPNRARVTDMKCSELYCRDYSVGIL